MLGAVIIAWRQASSCLRHLSTFKYSSLALSAPPMSCVPEPSLTGPVHSDVQLRVHANTMDTSEE